MKTICICGGGALGMVVASVLSHTREVSVCMLTAHPQQWSKSIETIDSAGKVYQGVLEKVSDRAAEVIPQSDIVLLCLPGFLIEKSLRQIAPFITNQAVGSIVSSTGFFFQAHRILDHSASLFGFQRVPYIARVREYGHSADLLGYKQQLYMATENLPADFEAMWSKWLQTPVAHMSNYLEASLSNSNPLLHPARLYGMWHGWNGEAYKVQTLFYAEWDEYSSDIYIAMDQEFQKLCSKVGVKIPSVLDYYESTDAISLTRKLRSIVAFQTIKAPMKQTAEGYIPDYESRYFTEDFPYGLQIIKELAQTHQIKTPMIDKVLTWGDKMIKRC
ncbi:MAG: NAD/NADP octopine/nopaline dehydrogenase family protein [Paludibacteraceae bacterium]|nr:NAD/NADP octopine/nopaline dehydrogenase family protein [Paludibacteraceae bacterium]